MANQFGQYLMYIFGEMLKNKNGNAASVKQEKKPSVNYSVFTFDETESVWHRQEDIEILQKFCREGYAMARKYGHFIIGASGERNYIGIPGRFLIEEQPAGGKTGFTLWQPLGGGEALYDCLDTIEPEQTDLIYGYWIAKLNAETLEIEEV